ncbi:conserved hypothetical protein [Syntrophaceticus schinkii]|uniref:Uncharacterized protein n=1 Tax=Syntrophaceticus schinkii TaxID=499207 RepID=A0A0B7MKP0_9FIRM|nr:conserved hypothetical protein [Syntrophaceticus schinkii]
MRLLGRFNPRTRTGCDLSLPYALPVLRWFQSTHPHGVRRELRKRTLQVYSFNPRTRTGCDMRYHL